MGIRRSMSTAYHPQSDGQTERMNRVLEDMLRHYVSPNQSDWDKHLPLVEFAINNAYQASVKETPFFLNYGQHPHTPASIYRQPTADESSGKPLVDRFADEVRATIAQAKQSLLAAQQRQKAFHDRRARARSFKVGDRALLSSGNVALKNPGTAKLLPKFIGPFAVQECVGTVAYRLLLPETMKDHEDP